MGLQPVEVFLGHPHLPEGVQVVCVNAVEDRLSLNRILLRRGLSLGYQNLLVASLAPEVDLDHGLNLVLSLAGLSPAALVVEAAQAVLALGVAVGGGVESGHLALEPAFLLIDLSKLGLEQLVPQQFRFLVLSPFLHIND